MPNGLSYRFIPEMNCFYNYFITLENWETVHAEENWKQSALFLSIWKCKENKPKTRSIV